MGVGLGVLLISGGDLASRLALQEVIASQVKHCTGAKGVSARIGSFPFVYDLVAEGHVSEATIVSSGVTAGLVTLDQVSISAKNIRFDRSQLLEHRKFVVTSVGPVKMSVRMTLSGLESAVTDILGFGIAPTPAGFNVTIDGRPVAEVALNQFFPDCPVTAKRSGDAISVSCSMPSVPRPALAEFSALQCPSASALAHFPKEA